MSNTELVIERYELKYKLPVELAPLVRQAILPYCRPDSASARGKYLISSLYLDTHDHAFYRHNLDGVTRRFKLRIRRYSTGPIFIECKRREKDVIVKTRVAVPQEAYPEVLLSPTGLRFAKTQRDKDNLLDFIRRMYDWGAGPKVVVRYAREAFVSEVDDYGRVTFDSEICGRPAHGWAIPMHEPGWTPVDGGVRFGLPSSGVVLELKATSIVPLWMSDIVRKFNLVRTGFSKFCSVTENTVPGVRPDPDFPFPSPWIVRSAP